MKRLTGTLSRIRTALAATALALALLPAAAHAMEKTSIILQWLPQAQFAGFYMAEDKGFYADAGIDMTLHQGGPDILASEWLETGKAEFATMFLSSAIIKRETIPLINVGQFVQNSALMLITKADSEILHPRELDGKRVGLWANEFEIQPRALFKRLGIDVTIVPQSSSLDLFMRNGVVACSGMWYNEFHLLQSYGLDDAELRPILFQDTDLNFPEDGIYTLEKTANQKPELCEAVVAATVKGWQYAFDHPDEAVNAVMRRMLEQRIPANRSHQRWMLNRMRDIIQTGAPMGVLKNADYDRVRTILQEMGFIDDGPMFPEFYRGPVK